MSLIDRGAAASCAPTYLGAVCPQPLSGHLFDHLGAVALF